MEVKNRKKVKKKQKIIKFENKYKITKNKTMKNLMKQKINRIKGKKLKKMNKNK